MRTALAILAAIYLAMLAFAPRADCEALTQSQCDRAQAVIDGAID